LSVFPTCYIGDNNEKEMAAAQQPTPAKAIKKTEAPRKHPGAAKSFGSSEMTRRFKVGDHVTWNSEAGRVTGKIIQVHTRDTEYKGYRRRASQEEPQYAIKSDKTAHIAMHKGGALKLMRPKA
jgi:hypothetical protein